MVRYVADCRKIPSKKKCTLRISGSLKEVMDVSVYHAVKTHGHKNSAALKKLIRKSLKKA